jgi:hypothetical protein
VVALMSLVGACGSVGSSLSDAGDGGHPSNTGDAADAPSSGSDAGGGLDTAGEPPADAAEDATAPDAGADTRDAAGEARSGECPGLIGYWPGDDDATDHAGNNDGTLQDGVTFARGQVGDAFMFDGTSSMVVPRAPGVQARGSWTYSLWINVAAYPNGDNTYFIDRNSPSAPLAGLVAHGSSFQFQVRYDDGSGLGGPVGGTISVSTWKHVAMVRDAGKQFYLYVDGQNVASIPDSGASLTPPPFKLGRHFNAANSGFSGLIDELKVYDGALTSSQIQALAQKQPCP